MKIKDSLILAVIVALAGCATQKTYPLQSKQAANGDWTLPYGEWSFSFVTPKDLMADTRHVRIIDTDGYLYTFNTLDQTSQSPDSTEKWSSAVHGGGVYFNKVKKPPQYIVFCWDSYADHKTYQTSTMFGPETWQRMKTPADHTRPSGAPVWYDRMVFGLSPGGKVKIWFSDVADAPASPLSPERW
ncbi:TPA: DUF2931 family protein [Enterobacter hormaechei]|uniref:DUF2931 family protein n=1 Tax=Enterobacter hormaechei TaxID=158836 RepID=UPI000AC30750|nr:DUF2931 family protein [Enterobacter hormaechei]MCM7438871.1 DUF2931 family protein [Enterobacter hormaechei]VAK68099.1 exported protein [Enterobacter hormaechei]